MWVWLIVRALPLFTHAFSLCICTYPRLDGEEFYVTFGESVASSFFMKLLISSDGEVILSFSFAVSPTLKNIQLSYMEMTSLYTF